uniref:Uncharacterized protein n=1 Tax=Ciona intestinalis TaxID=7719 RepID=H2XS70_CIOIN
MTALPHIWIIKTNTHKCTVSAALYILCNKVYMMYI